MWPAAVITGAKLIKKEYVQKSWGSSLPTSKGWPFTNGTDAEYSASPHPQSQVLHTTLFSSKRGL